MLYVPRALTAHSKRKTKLNGISEAAFDFVEPLIKLAWPQWKGMDRYGVTRITHPSCLALINELRGAAIKPTDGCRRQSGSGTPAPTSRTKFGRSLLQTLDATKKQQLYFAALRNGLKARWRVMMAALPSPWVSK